MPPARVSCLVHLALVGGGVVLAEILQGVAAARRRRARPLGRHQVRQIDHALAARANAMFSCMQIE